MSVSGLIDLAVARGSRKPPEQKRRYAPADETEQTKPTPAGLGVLVSVIPVEIITLYTAFVAATVTRSTPSVASLRRYKRSHAMDFPYEQTQTLIELRWIVFSLLAISLGGIVFTGWKKAKKTTDKRKWPLGEIFGGVVAFAAWGLAMPGGLLAPYVRSDDLAVVTLALITCVAAGLIALGIGVLKNSTKKAV